MTGAVALFSFISCIYLFCRTPSKTQNGLGEFDVDKTTTQNITSFPVSRVTILEKISKIYPEQGWFVLSLNCFGGSSWNLTRYFRWRA